MGLRHNNERKTDQAQFRNIFKHAQLRKIQGYCSYILYYSKQLHCTVQYGIITVQLQLLNLGWNS